MPYVPSRVESSIRIKCVCVSFRYAVLMQRVHYGSEKVLVVPNVTFDGSTSVLQTRQHARLYAQRLNVLASLCQVPWVLLDFTSLFGADLLSKCIGEALEERLCSGAEAI